MSSANGGSANPLAGGQSASQTPANPLAGGLVTPNPAQAGAPAGGNAGSNPLAGGSSDPQNAAPNSDETGPVARDVYNERVRAEAALRKANAEFRERLQALEDAKLTEHERTTKRLAETEAEKSALQIAHQALLVQVAIDAQVREKNLVDANVVRAILLADYADELEYDDKGVPVNVDYCISRAIEKYPSLVQAPSSPVPGSGRSVSPSRTPGGQYAPQRPQQPPQPLPYNQFPGWSQLTDADWDTESRKRQREPGQ